MGVRSEAVDSGECTLATESLVPVAGRSIRVSSSYFANISRLVSGGLLWIARLAIAAATKTPESQIWIS
jgi:hypothetical protein